MRNPRPLHFIVAMTLMCLATTASAVDTPMTLAFDLPSTDVAVAGVGGIGERGPPGLGGAGVLALSGVSGTVQKAWLYWHGIDWEKAEYGFVGGNFDYDEATIEFDGNEITGTRIAGVGDNNCWGNDSSPIDETAALYRADVTSQVQVQGNGDYVLSGLADGAGHSANGLSLIVYFDDGNPDNDFRVRHFEGLKADWNTTFKVYYQGGPVEAILHVVDGQASYAQNATHWEALPSYPGGSGINRIIYQPTHDGEPLWAGLSVPNMLRPRPPDGNGLWDIQRLSFSGVFGPMRDYDVTLRGGGTAATQTDCYSMMVLQVLEPVSRKALAMEPSWHDFGQVEAHTSSVAQVFTVTNWMDLPISFPLPPQVLSEPGLFPISANNCTGQTLQPGGQCDFSVSCTPPGVIGSTENNTLLLTWRAEFSPVFDGRVYSTLDCGFHIAPDIRGLQIDPVEFHFGSTASGQYSAPQDFIVRNSGTSPLTMQNILGLANGFELVDNSCTNGLVLAPDAECQVRVRFHAEGSPGSTRATLLFATFSQGNDGFDRSGSELYATTDLAYGDTIFEDGFD
jgi:hypothetical protein